MGRISGPTRKWTVSATEICDTRTEAERKAETHKAPNTRTRIRYNAGRDRSGRRTGGGFYVLYVYQTD
jgi:hypothetical protein